MGLIVTMNKPGELHMLNKQKRSKSIVAIAEEQWEKMTNEEQQKVKQKFESTYGVDQKTRTSKQWNNLVNLYGIEVVAKKENMSVSQVKKKMKISKSKLLSKK